MHHASDPSKSLNISDYQKEPLLEKMVENGERLAEPRPLDEIAEYSRNRLSKLSGEYKRFENPHIYKVGLSQALKKERDRLVEQYEEKTEFVSE